MTRETYYRRLVGNFKFVTIAIPAVVSLMWFATVADYLFDLGGGWDEQIIWIAPIIVAGGLVVRFVGFAIFRLVGAMPPRS